MENEKRDVVSAVVWEIPQADSWGWQVDFSDGTDVGGIVWSVTEAREKCRAFGLEMNDIETIWEGI